MSFLKIIWKNSKHEKLSEELALQNTKEPENDTNKITNDNDVITFKLKYLGSSVIEKVSGDNIHVGAVKDILKITKLQRRKMQRVNMTVSLKGIAVTDNDGNEVLKVSIYRISNCSTDPSHRQIFSFTSTDANDTTECHAFLCSKRKIAETVALTVAHAFTTAYDAWRILPSTRQFEKSGIETETHRPSLEEIVNQQIKDIPHNSKDEGSSKEEKLIELDDELSALVKIPKSRPRSKLQMQLQREWVSFDEDLVGNEEPLSNNKLDLLVA